LDDENFKDHHLVAILLAKLYFYLSDYDESLTYALRAGKYFDITTNDDFTDILVNKCIEKYIKNCQEKNELSDEHNQYRTIINFCVDNNINKAEYRLPLGIAIETHDTNLFRRLNDVMEFNEMIEFLLPHLLSIDLSFRNSILELIVKRIPENFSCPHQYINLIQVLQVKGDYEAVSKIIYDCTRRGEL
jgi:26S proteasome regulatory subunit N2